MPSTGKRALVILIFTFLSYGSWLNFSQAAIEATQFESSELEKRYQGLIAELRCLVCQNQNLADSDAELAKDLRRKTTEMLKAGHTDQQILDFMQERYGDFVLYRPPFNSTTAILWLGPFILLLFAVIVVFRMSGQKKQGLAVTPSESSINKAKELLSNDARESSYGNKEEVKEERKEND